VQDSLFDSKGLFKFTAAHRLSRVEGYDHVVHAANLSNKFFKIYFVCNGKRNSRLGIVASKRVLSGAVQRNRAKRKVREAFRQHNIKTQQLDLVVVVRSADTQASQIGDLITLFSRIENKCAI